MQSIHVDEFTDLDGHGYGVRLQTAPLHPGFFVSFAPWDGAERMPSWSRDCPYTAAVGMTVRDRDGGEVKVGRDGEPVVHYKLPAQGAAHLQRGFEAAAEMLETVGAQRIFSSHASLHRLRTRAAAETGSGFMPRFRCGGLEPGTRPAHGFPPARARAGIGS